MGIHTEIGWCDSTVNPTTGCDGCELHVVGKGGPCYAGILHEGRLAKSLPTLYSPTFTDVRLAPGRMAKSASWSDLRGKARPNKPWLDGMPRLIFVGDMGDIFSKDVPVEYLASELIETAEGKAGRRHCWLVLTKQPQRLAEFAAWLGRWPENVWVGTSVTSQTNASRAIKLLEVPAEVHFISAEPLLSGVVFNEMRHQIPGSLGVIIGSILGNTDGSSFSPRSRGKGLDWLIVGGESGPGARPCDLAWIRSIVRQCGESKTPCFVKQLGTKAIDSDRRISIDGPGSHAVAIDLADPKGGDWSEWPEDLRVRQMPNPGSNTCSGS
jgi:protein gp37